MSGRDAARAAMGQGRPFAACPWNVDGANAPGTKRSAVMGRMSGAFLLGHFFLPHSKKK